MSNYYRVKKYRELKRKRSACDNESVCTVHKKDDGQTSKNVVKTNVINNIVSIEKEINDDELPIVSDNEFSSFEESIPLKTDINEKIAQWTLRNLDTLRLNVVTELLSILREQGHTSLPRTAQALLGTKHHRILQTMTSNRETEGSYMYLGIQRGLEKIVSPNVYRESEICVLIHVDGMQIYNNSQIQVWPISVKIVHSNYACKPFVAGIYCGDSKPQSSNNFLNDFVMEATNLTSNGVELHGKIYSFKICALVADAPARAFIKYCKPHNSFYACERCTTKGVSVGKNRSIKRVYPEMNCNKRSKESFESREQPQHHKDHVDSVLLKLPDFDIINSVVIDSMHLLYLGVMKTLLEKWVIKKSIVGLKRRHVRHLRDLMISMSRDIPCEFQRKTFDINAIARWKATQFRFFLLYCSSTVLYNILPNHYYRHFLLLFVACRILNKQNVTLSYCDYAKNLLRKFFYLLPSLYGEQSQVLSMHYLIHVADDVANFKMPLSELSAFWGESYISIFKKLVKSPKKPLVQIINRLSELESEKTFKIKEKQYLDNCVYQNSNTYVYEEENYIIISSIKVNNFVLKCERPDNVVQLSDDKVLKIDAILLKKQGTENILKLENLYVLGYVLADRRESFNYPISSKEVGICVSAKFFESKEMFPLKDVQHKCILLNINNSHYVISLLHTCNM